jgi:exopolysaccharide biosynthesis polyprenyl glycosylphosphotransferase
VLAVLTLASVFITGGHSRHRALNQPARLLVASAAATLASWVPFFIRGYSPTALAPLAATAITLCFFLLCFRQPAEWFLRDIWPKQRGAGPALVIGYPGASRAFEDAIGAPGGDYRVVGYLAPQPSADEGLLGSIAQLSTLIEANEIEAVAICTDLPIERTSEIIDECIRSGCQILFPARAVRLPDLRPTLVWHHDQPFLEVGSPVLKAKALISKRITDVIVSSILLVLLSPILAIIAIAIRLDSPGSPFFLQERAGLGGRRFRMLKFRTMRAGADSEKDKLAHLNHTGDQRLFKIPQDPRTTRLGRFLRRWSIDELPQLLNVLGGTMSLVGPRPFFQSDFQAYEDHHFRRLDAKPGITGLWQVSGRSEMLDFEDVIYLDRQYIEQWSFWLDVSILFRTIPAVLRRTGAF